MSQCAVLTQPLAHFMDRISLVETIRQRVRLKTQGVQLGDSRCKYTESDLVQMNLQILSGEAGSDVIAAGYSLLLQPPEAAVWYPEFNMPYHESVLALLASMCDSWRRLVLPYQTFTYRILRIASMDADEGLEYIWREHNKVKHCCLCRDQYFAKAPWPSSACFVSCQQYYFQHLNVMCEHYYYY